MSHTTRRRFLKQTGQSLAGAAALPLTQWKLTAAQTPRHGIPSHRALHPSGLHAYSDVQSVAAGQSISFHVSSTVGYRLSICRLGLNTEDPGGDEVLHELPASGSLAHPIHPGSYVHVAKGLSARRPRNALTLECWVRLWKTDAWAGLLGQFGFEDSGGYALLVNPAGGVSFYLAGDGDFQEANLLASKAGAVLKNRWHHVVGVWDGREKSLWIDGQAAARTPFAGPVVPGASPLRLGACGGNDGQADHFLDGDMAMPAIYQRALSPEEIQERFRQQGLQPARGQDVLGCWTLSEERGDRIADRSPERRHGRIINHATWMIGGPSFEADVTRFGSYDPGKDPKRGHGLRFAADDLYDCRWPVTHQYRIPSTARPGIYVGRFRYAWEGKPHLYHVTFIVRKAPRRKPAPILFLTATNTWRAYSGTPFAVASPELKQVWGTGGRKNDPTNPPAYCFYRGHAAGQGTYQLGLRMPWPVAGPYVLYGGPTQYSHLMRADRFAQVWLERSGYDYDVITDLDLHQEPGLLRSYQVVVINGHSEYWSLPMYQGLERYLQKGGNVVCLSGNSLFWRVSFNEDGTILECRKVDAPGEQMPPNRRGECWHSQDGLRGGLLRECGFPGWKLIGLDTLGWNNQSADEQFGPFHVTDPGHFLFHQPEETGLKKGEPFGQAPGGKLPRANGHEIDVRVSTLAALQEQPNPPGAELPSEPPGMTQLANGVIPWKLGGAAFDYFLRPIKPKSDQGGEIIYWERPDGGRVFNVGSIGAGWGLMADEKFQVLLRNVLAHFGVKPGL